MVVKDENLADPTQPARPAGTDDPSREPATPADPHGEWVERESHDHSDPADGAGDRSGLLSLSRALEGDDLLAAPTSLLPPDGPSGGAPDKCAGEPAGANEGARTRRPMPTEESVPSPLDALDALGAVGSPQMRLVSRGEADREADADSGVAPDPAAQFQTIFREAVLQEVREHGEGQDKVEVCGVLVGSVYENTSGAFCYVEGCIRGNYAAGGSAQVTFTAETWQHIDREMEDRFPGRKIVGWYHTHPGFGIFLSEMDLFIHRHFFNAPWQTALVYDPHSRERGLFGWDGTEIVRQTFVLDNEIGPAVTEAAGPNLSPKPHGLEDTPAGGPPGSAAELSARIKLLEQRQRYMLVGMAALMLVAVVWPLVVLVAMSSSDGIGAPAPLSPAPALDRPPTVTQGADSASAAAP